MCPECLTGMALMAVARAVSSPPVAAFVAPSATLVARTLPVKAGRKHTKLLFRSKGERDGSSKNRLASAVARCP